MAFRFALRPVSGMYRTHAAPRIRNGMACVSARLECIGQSTVIPIFLLQVDVGLRADARAEQPFTPSSSRHGRGTGPERSVVCREVVGVVLDVRERHPLDERSARPPGHRGRERVEKSRTGKRSRVGIRVHVCPNSTTRRMDVVEATLPISY